MSKSENPAAGERRSTTSGDALLLGVAMFGMLIGISLLSFETAVGIGVLVLAFVVLKVLTT